MCRLYGFRSNERTKVECTLAYAQNALLVQSRSDERGMSHADGWGLGLYRGEVALVERSTRAAFEGPRFEEAAARAYARTVVAHVRKATVGGSARENTHPFAHRRWLFAHNGTAQAFARVAEQLARETDPDLARQRRGTTDSEAIFYWTLTRWRGEGGDLDRPCADPKALARSLAGSVARLARWCEELEPMEKTRLNLVLTDGRTLVASRYQHSLSWVERRRVHDCEICGIPHVEHDSDASYRAVVVASEPLSSEDWTPLDEPSVLWVGPDLTVHCAAL